MDTNVMIASANRLDTNVEKDRYYNVMNLIWVGYDC